MKYFTVIQTEDAFSCRLRPTSGGASINYRISFVFHKNKWKASKKHFLALTNYMEICQITSDLSYFKTGASNYFYFHVVLLQAVFRS